ncbi:MAG: hypothetical protein M3082_06870 [Candidatus Dormibacteraeota bacterium]|nr:hypothetical protein [Candidatus Dormibacteraeota bacterium]
MSSGRVPLGMAARLMLDLADRGGRFRLLSLWQRWEPIAMWLWRVRHVQQGGMLQFGASPYRGPTTTLLDGTLVRKGDRILHLHFDNRLINQVVASIESTPWTLVDMARNDLDSLAAQVASGRLGEVRAIRGITVLAPAAGRAGFEVRPLPHNLRWALVRHLSALVMASYHRDGPRELDRGLPWPGEVWMSASALRGRLQTRHRVAAHASEGGVASWP